MNILRLALGALAPTWFACAALAQQNPPPWLYRGIESPLVLTVVAQRLVHGFPAPGITPDTVDLSAPRVPTESNGISYTAYKSAFKTYRIGSREVLQTLLRGGVLPGDSISGWRLIMVHTKWGWCAPYAVHRKLGTIPIGAWLKMDVVETQIARVGRDQVTSLSYLDPAPPNPRTGGFVQTNLSDINLTFTPPASAEAITFRFAASGNFTEAFHYDADRYVGGHAYPAPLSRRQCASGPMAGKLWLDAPDPRFSEKMLAQVTLRLDAPSRIDDLRTRFADLLRTDRVPWHQLAQDPIP